MLSDWGDTLDQGWEKALEESTVLFWIVGTSEFGLGVPVVLERLLHGLKANSQLRV